MIFTSADFLVFFALVFAGYWALASLAAAPARPRRLTPDAARRAQNVLLLVGSYVFYGWVTPWFCLLIAGSTVVDYLCGRAMGAAPEDGTGRGRRRTALVLSLAFNLGLLGTFKYFDFFSESFAEVARALGLELSPWTLGVLLPVGISFYTFQTLSYTIDVYRGRLEPRTSLLDFAVFVSFFPQLVAGPIERAVRFLPQVEAPRTWDWTRARSALHLIVGGYLKKLVVADNLAVYVDEIFMLREPPLSLLAVGALAFAFQILADFSAYTDIARGAARLLGFELMENFRSPYLAVSPSDFWRRWHISFSSWIRDYLYIPLGGSRTGGPARFLGVLLVSMGLSGLWHGAAWNFVLWGVFHAVILFAYHRVGRGARHEPATLPGRAFAIAIMFGLTLLGWLVFRTHDVGWLWAALTSGHAGLGGDHGLAALYTLSLVLLYSAPLLLLFAAERLAGEGSRVVRGAVSGVALVLIAAFARDAGVDFIYFRF